MNHPKLYKRTATGAVQVWWQETNADRYRTHSGQDGGQIVVSEWTVAQAKNIGTRRETTPETQAALEVEANYTLKRKKGYTDTPHAAMDSVRFQPMLAKTFADYGKDVAFHLKAKGPVFLQPKLDGIRCLASTQGLVSRAGNRIVAVPHIEAAVAELLDFDDSVVLDGELYSHELKHDFNKIVSLVRKTKPTAADTEAAAQIIEYWIYDIYFGQDPGAPTAERLGVVERMASAAPACIVWVPTVAARDMETIDATHAEYLEAGFEGTMIRLDGPYEQKRSKLLLKHKDFQDAEFRVKAVREGLGNKSGMAGYVELYLPDGREFSAAIIGDRDYCRELLRHADAAVGKQATVDFFQYTPDGVPRFPRVKTIHMEKRW